MHRREKTLRFRAIPEQPEERIEHKIISALAKWLEIKEQEITQNIERVFRVRSSIARAKWLGDCLVTCVTMDIRDRILQISSKKKLRIEENDIIHKIIPTRLLRKRDKYEPLVEALKGKSIIHRWEFPEGISFFFKGKRRRFTFWEDADKFWRQYQRELGGQKQLGGL